MAQPTTYNRVASFSNLQAQNPDDPTPGSTLDSEFNAIKTTLDQVLANLKLIQRDDGKIINEGVGLDQLSEEIEVGWEAPTVWVTSTAYVKGNTVFRTSGFYRCLVAHTSGTFSTDLAASKWELIVDLSTLTIVDATQIAFTPTGGIAASTVSGALAELDSEKAASSHTHPSSAISDSTAAGRSMLSAADAAAQRTLLGLGSLALLNTVPVTAITAEVALTGIIEPSALTVDTNDWAPTGIATCSTIRMSASAAISLTGILAPATDGTVMVLENIGSSTITLAPSSSASAAANRFLIPRPIIVGPNSSVVLKYDKDATTPRWRLFDKPSHLPRGWIDGLTLSNNGSDATNDIDIAAGECRGTRGILDLVLSTGLTKRLDADWAAGTGNGMREATAIANGTYHIFLIGKADGTTDVFAYTGTDPTSVLPSGYIDYHRIGSILRESAAIVLFVQDGDIFSRKTLAADVSATNPGGTAVTRTLSVPTGIKVWARVHTGATTGGSVPTVAILLTDLNETDEAPSPGINATVTAPTSSSGAGPFEVLTNTSAQIRSRINGSAADVTFKITTRGWRDQRGRNA